MKAAPEYALHCATADLLRAVLDPASAWFTTVGHGGGGKVRGARLKRAGVRPGVADILIFWRGGILSANVLWLELKSAKGRISPEQIEFSHDVIRAGHYYKIARDLTEVETVLRDLRVPVRGKIAA